LWDASIAVFYYHDANHADSIADHESCVAICPRDYYQVQTNINCVTSCAGSYKFRHERPLNEINTSVTTERVINNCVTKCPASLKYFATDGSEYLCADTCDDDKFYDINSDSDDEQTFCADSCTSGVYNAVDGTSRKVCTERCVDNAEADAAWT
jgi:ferredoxin-like protein FixX